VKFMDHWTETIRASNELDSGQIAELCDELFDAKNEIAIRAGWLAALSARGETASEIAAFVRTLLGRAVVFPGTADGEVTIDVCGTGGDKLGLFNISTAVMFVVAACGVKVIKHGNRGITSKSGGADVLEASGVRINLNPDQSAEVLAETGCVFLFAPIYHPTFREVAPVRQMLAAQGIVTIFNKLGPLLNPAPPTRQLAGVYQESLIPLYAQVFAELGRDRAWAVHGKLDGGGMDELSTLGPCVVCEVLEGQIKTFELNAKDFGISTPEVSELAGGDAAANAVILKDLLNGKLPGPIEDMVAWNAAAALVVGGACDDLAAGLSLARAALRNGTAWDRLDHLVAATNRVG
jgi:anthranilate phosphoribosyltransferase